MQEVLGNEDEEIEHFQSMCIVYAFKKTKFIEELKRLSEIVEKLTWNAAARVAQMHSQLQLAQE